MKIFVGLLAIVAFSAQHVSADKCHLRELDLCAASAAGAQKVPASDEEVDKYCALGKEAKECVDTFVQQCTTPIQRELVTWATKDPIKNAEDFCKKGSKTRADYLKYAPCLAKAQPEGKKCLDDIHAGLEKLEKAKFADRIPTACCIYERYRKCSTDVVEKQCGADAIRHGSAVLNKNVGTTLNVICQGFENNPKCNSLLPPVGTKASGASKSIVSKLFSAYIGSK